MGWINGTGNYANLPRMYNYIIDASSSTFHTYEYATPQYFKWMRGHLWYEYEAAIKFVNDTGDKLKLNRVSIKSVSCNSDGQPFWSSSGITSAAGGYGGTYRVYIRVSNPTGRSGGIIGTDDSTNNSSDRIWESTNQVTQHVNVITNSNMDTPGTSTTNTASFGMNYYPEQYAMLQLYEYTFEDAPIIEENGIAFLHFGFTCDGDQRSTYIEFILDPREMEIVFDQERGPYIWRFCEDNQWHLRRPLQVGTANGWTDVEDL